MSTSLQLAPPWRELLPSGQLGEPYGPRTLATYARMVASYRDWAYQPGAQVARDADRLWAYMRLPDGTLRLDVPASEVQVYRLVVEGGQSVRQAAREMGVQRDTARSYLRRLRARVP